ncbi:hypothetical protein [Catellatospora chokoriensis]|uniref:MalK-like OB fold domain-containing protein n=1 Tax=Catellatospora chokoriensis TaxID=310353 RepID=A0A8J3JZJ2_9ACTN|nr:hypothetical protein [Catellatospora chokoriensis]GIF93981.1 hypothetical protein Cch02nite_74250 [Catellatospora chokoriensis]
MATVAIDRLGKTFPNAARPVLDEVSLTVGDGEFLVLVGPSGCGKLFVAGFIGSPAMNLALGRVEPGTDGPVLALGTHRWPVPAAVLDRLAGLNTDAGHDVVVGLRPGALGLASHATGQADITVAAITVEALGDETNVLFLPPFPVPDVIRAGTGPADTELAAMWTARLEPDVSVTAGDDLTLALDLAQAYLFDAVTGMALHPAEADVAAA